MHATPPSTLTLPLGITSFSKTPGPHGHVHSPSSCKTICQLRSPHQSEQDVLHDRVHLDLNALVRLLLDLLEALCSLRPQADAAEQHLVGPLPLPAPVQATVSRT